MTAQGGFGLTLKIDVSSSLTAIVQVLTSDFPEFLKFIAESTGHDAPSGYYQSTATGKRRLNPFTVTIAWDTSVTTHATIVTAFDSDEAVDMSIADPDSDETIAFSAHIETVGRISEQQDIYKADVLIHPSGPPTIT